MACHDERVLIEEVALILREALRMRATRVHIEPGSEKISVRFRVDGTLHDCQTLPADMLEPIVKSLQKLADIDIEENALPQDGIMELSGGDLQGVYAINIIPGLAGARVHIVPYRRGRMEFCLHRLGLEDTQLETIREAISSPKPSMVIVSGPTNSGKNTTIYSALLEMRKCNFSVATVESEQRAQLPGVHQVITDEDNGLTFAAIGRALLRADVDVMFISELFDYETAELAFRAVLDRNKFVFTALRCQDTMATINRLTNMDIDPWLIAEAVSVIQGQRPCANSALTARSRLMSPRRFLSGRALRRSLPLKQKYTAVWVARHAAIPAIMACFSWRKPSE